MLYQVGTLGDSKGVKWPISGLSSKTILCTWGHRTHILNGYGTKQVWDVVIETVLKCVQLGIITLWCFHCEGTKHFMLSHLILTTLRQFLYWVLFREWWIWGSEVWGCTPTECESKDSSWVEGKVVCACVMLVCVCSGMCQVCFVYSLGPFSFLLQTALCPGWLTCVDYTSEHPCALGFPDRFDHWRDPVGEHWRSEGR